MEIYIAGEDPVTLAIIRRLVTSFRPDLSIIMEMPYRGGKLDKEYSNFNSLSSKFPVIVLRDLDMFDCPPQLISRLLPFQKSPNFVFNVAADEAEAWLLADKSNFSRYFEIPLQMIPGSIQKRQNGPRAVLEVNTPYKTSQYFQRELLPHSKSLTIQQQLRPKHGAVKGTEYNHVMIPFIKQIWDPQTARLNSYSLDRMINRLMNIPDLVVI